MNKPISIVIHDTKEEIIEVINRNQMPASVMLLVIKDILSEIEKIDRQVYARDLKEYAEEVEKESTEISEE